MRAALLSALILCFAPALAQSAPNPAPVGKKRTALKTGIEWKVTPASVEIYLGKKKLGTAGKLTFTKVRAGRHQVRLVKGGDETEMEVRVVKNQTLRFAFAFDE